MGTFKAPRFSCPFRFCSVVAVTVTIAVCAAAQEPPPIRLLPTDRDAARIRALEDALANHEAENVQASYAELKRIIQDFVTRQLDAAPAIPDVVLHDQLLEVIGRTWGDEPDGAVYVQSGSDWGPRSKQRVWAIAYVVWLGIHGLGGTGAVIDSYVWEKGRARLAGRQDADFSGYSLHVDWLAGSPHQVSLLANGRLSGSNGLGAWKATVYFCDPLGVHTIWQSPILHGLTAVARGQVIALRHARPAERAASSAASWTYEVYVFDPRAFEPPTVTLVSRETRNR